ncbi:hypothetical protein DPMN_060120 [Dreissena polymorpha]|uniref:Uncharacterized protein n=1 Tax=Dreissena polymorpha TaxID=45954 RepID=A0A9D4HHV3_DREPO|nr:hypothetical protein DPMN_060120 [Dreissena polymorpha]
MIGQNIVTSRVLTRKIAPPTGGHANIFTKFHENWAKNVTSIVEKCSAPWRPCFFHRSRTFSNSSAIIKKNHNVLTNFHDDWAKIVTSRVFTRKIATPTGGHVFQRTGITFELNQHIIKANILTNFELDRDITGTHFLTKFHEDRTINVACSVITNKCGWTDDGRTTDGWTDGWTTDKNRSQKLT